MKLIAPLISLLLPTCAFSILTKVFYDDVYGNKDYSLNGVACSYPLYKKYGTFGKVPKFPRIGGAFVVNGFKSPNCGTCWNVTYPPLEVSVNGGRRTIPVFLVDSTKDGVVLSREAMDELTDGEAFEFGHVEADLVQVSGKFCGVSA
jgi:hypothetical protein